MRNSAFGPQRPNWLLYSTQQNAQHRARGSSYTSPPPLTMYINAVYYPNWKIYRDQRPSSLRIDCISFIFYAFAGVQVDGTVCFNDEWADLQIDVDGAKGCVDACTQLKKQNGLLRVVLSIGGAAGSANFAALARNPESRTRFAQTARDLVINKNLDGIDIDWEHPSTPQEGEDLVELLKTVRAYLPSPRFYVTIALPAGAWALKHIDLASMAQHVDLVNLMAYDFTGPWTSNAGHHARLFAGSDMSHDVSGSAAVQYFISHGVPAGKILLGVPTYGRSFIGATRPGIPYVGHGGDSEGTFEYKELPFQNTREIVDTAACAAYCIDENPPTPPTSSSSTIEHLTTVTGTGGVLTGVTTPSSSISNSSRPGGFITYDNPDTVRIKARFVKEAKLAGLFYWHATSDSELPSRSLVLNGFEGLLPV